MKNKKKLKIQNYKKKLYKLSHKKRNKEKKIENGNIIRNKIKIIQWNKGSKMIMNCMNELKDLIENMKPDILIINELNLEKEINIDHININGYNI